MIARFSPLIYVSLGIAVFLLLAGGAAKHDDIYVAVQPHLQKVHDSIKQAHAWACASLLRSAAEDLDKAVADPEPWSPSYRVPSMSRGDVLRRRDFHSNSLKPVPIKRPSNPLQGLDLSSSFQHAWHRMQAVDPDVPREYRRSLEALAAEDKMAQCGPWVQDYTRMHEQISAQYNDSAVTLGPGEDVVPGSRHGRLVAACFKEAGQCGGLGDRMFGTASTFMMSLLTDRAFLLHWAHDYPVLAEETFESPYINWAWQAPPPSIDRFSDSVGPGEKAVFQNPHTMFIQWPGDMLDQYWTHASREVLETETFRNGETVTVQGNKGMLVRTLQDHSTWQSKKLREMGMTPENAWNCVWNYLVNPIPDTARLIAKYQALLRMPSVFSVGVQVRAGDWVFTPENHKGQDWDNVKQYDYFLKCAADAAVAFADPAVHKHFVIFLVTDNSNFAAKAASDPRYFLEDGWEHPVIPNFEPLVISIGSELIHLEKGDDEATQGVHSTLSAKKRHYAMQSSILDNMVFDATDRQLICGWSGFGYISHLRASFYTGNSAIPMGATGPEGGVLPLSADGLPCNSTKAFWSLQQWAFNGTKFA